MTCEDFPCCGHEAGCCPDFDESGRQLNMICVCGARLPVDNPVSICDSCLNEGNEDYDYDEDYDEEEWEYRQDLMLEQQEREDFCETDEAYGYFGGEY